jgi:hypothetical protein
LKLLVPLGTSFLMQPATLECESALCICVVHDTDSRAVGMAILLRSYVHHFRRGRYVVPVQLAKEYGLKVLPTFQLLTVLSLLILQLHQSHTKEQAKALSQCFYVMCDVVSQHLNHAKKCWPLLTTNQKQLFQDCIYAKNVVDHLEKCDYSPFLADASNETTRLRLQILLAKSALKNKFLSDASW